MQGVLKRIKVDVKVYIFPLIELLKTPTITTCILNQLPIINRLALLRAFPHILDKGWITIGSIIDEIYTKLATKMHKDLFNNKWSYTGSLLLEVLTDEIYTNGKHDVDRLVKSDYDFIKLLPNFTEKGKYINNIGYYDNDYDDPSPNSYCICLELISDDRNSLDLVKCDDSSKKKKVNTFDFSFCRNYISHEMLYINDMESIIKKRTSINIDRYLRARQVGSQGSNAEDCIYRLQKYTKRGFKITITHEFKDIDDFTSQDIGYNRSYTPWFENRPEKGVFKINK